MSENSFGMPLDTHKWYYTKSARQPEIEKVGYMQQLQLTVNHYGQIIPISTVTKR
jgi:hypothetical protein